MASNFNSQQNRYEIRRARRAQRLGLTGPVLLIALGVMFLVGEFVPHWGVGKTWPVILIVIGLAKLIESVWGASSTPPR
jgi:membrane-bound ClpP family serine protease